jgi:hypothetical protein
MKLDIDFPPRDSVLDELAGNGADSAQVASAIVEYLDFAVHPIPSI